MVKVDMCFFKDISFQICSLSIHYIVINIIQNIIIFIVMILRLQQFSH